MYICVCGNMSVYLYVCVCTHAHTHIYIMSYMYIRLRTEIRACTFHIHLIQLFNRAVVQGVTAPEVRGSAFAVFNLTDDLGKGLGPLLVDGLVRTCGNKNTAYNIAICFWLVCAMMLASIAYTLEDDEAR